MKPHAPQLTTCTFLFAALLFGPACSTDGDGDGNGNGNGADADIGDNTPDAAVGTGNFVNLISGDWEIPAGEEFYRCVRKTVTEDTYITGFRSIGPLGTHHTVLTVGPSTGADGITTCGAGTNNEAVIFGSGVGDIEYNFPAGVGVKIEAGQQLLLNLHLFNVADAPITGTSGSEAILVSAADVQNEAEAVLMGDVNLNILPGTQTEVGSCTLERDVTLLTISPHMHQLGTHMKVEALRADGDVLVHDAPYDFYDQKLYPLDAPLSMKQGDKIQVTCSYNNTTGSAVSFGDSSNKEMCFGTMYRYPKRDSRPTGIACIF